VAPDEVAALHEHVQGCAYCQPRYEAQCRSLSRASAPPRAGDELIDALIAALEAITPEAEPMPAGVEGGEAADAEAATLTSFAGLETLGPGRQPLAPPAPAPAPKARSEVKRPG
jgi:hypothetical protein